MEAENPHHGHQPHSSEEAAIHAAAAAAAADVVEVGERVLPMEKEVTVALAGYDADLSLDLDLDAAVAGDEAFAQALYMEELMQVEDDNWDVHRRFGFEQPRRIVFHHFGAHAGEERTAEQQAVHHQFPDQFGAHAGEERTAEQQAVHHQFPDQFGAHAGEEKTAEQQAVHNHQVPAAGSEPPPVVFNNTTHHQPVGRSGEVITTRLEPRSSASTDVVISVRQAVLGHDYSAPGVVIAGMEEEEHDNSWYQSIVHEAQMNEQMEEPEAYEPFQFHTQLPASSPRERREEQPCYNPSDFDPDEPGPSTARRVLPLADNELPKFNCGICMETLPILDIFHGMQCQHKFCVECMATYIEGRIHAGEVPIPCPDPACRDKLQGGDEDNNNNHKSILHPEDCKKSIDFAAFGNWGIRLTESAIPANQRAYCPNEQCGVMLEATGGKTPVMAFCPVCGHPMCATCGTDWSSDDSANHDCTEGPGGALVKKIAEKRHWKQCPRCMMLVEKIDGCNVLRCRCHFVFCYACVLPTGRQTGMEEGAELCQCYDTIQHAPMHPEWQD